MRIRSVTPLALLLIVALGLAACSSEKPVACAAMTSTSTDLSVKPEISIPEDTEPTQILRACDVVEGTGPALLVGDEITVHYVGHAWSTREQFAASWDLPEPFQMQIGQGLVVDGWELGLIGARVGGRRELIIPPHLAYGPEGREGIAPNETLVFIIDVLSKDA